MQACRNLTMVGTARAFLNLIRKANPALFASVRLPTLSDPKQSALPSVHFDVPNVDFSGAILACCPDELSVVSASHVGWSDLGSPDRVLDGRALARSSVVQLAFGSMSFLPADANASQQILEPRIGAQRVEVGTHEHPRAKSLGIGFL